MDANNHSIALDSNLKLTSNVCTSGTYACTQGCCPCPRGYTSFNQGIKCTKCDNGTYIRLYELNPGESPYNSGIYV